MSRVSFLLMLCLGAGLYQNRHRIDHWINPPHLRPPGADKVVLYATQWCGYCAKTRRFFAENEISYIELDVENSEQGQSEYRKLGGGGVPIVVVNGETVIRGYDPDGFVEALGRTP